MNSLATRVATTVLFSLLMQSCERSAAPQTTSNRIEVAAPAATNPSGFYSSFKTSPPVAQMTELGRALFFEPSLSASGKISCATCHDPAHAYGPPNDLSVQLGGRDMKSPGLRAVPSLRYTQSVPPFTEHFHDDDGDDSIDQGPAGGRTWDGRAQSAHDQARLPLLSEFEMANADENEVVAKVEHGPHANEMRTAFGADLFNDSALAFKAIQLVLEVFQQSPKDFYPYDSKYDAYLRHQVQLTAQEARGLALFNEATKGNCASCHKSAIMEGALPQFTDYGLIAIGVPRNQKLAANANPDYYDLGVCGPLRTDLATHKEYCGLFRTPSLRNVALRHTFFHNGRFHDLKTAMQFYVQRDTAPEKWYRRHKDGTVDIFDDLPAGYHDNVNVDPPFDRHKGEKPALSDAEIDDVIVFLQTLTDGFRAPVTSPAK